jgi:hypothetical protein
MRKRRVVLAVVVLFVVGAAVWLWTAPPPSALRSGFNKVQVGMTRAEVDTILGESQGALMVLRGHESPISFDTKLEWWGSSAESVIVEFDDFSRTGTVVSKRFEEPPGPFLRAWWWLRSLAFLKR